VGCGAWRTAGRERDVFAIAALATAAALCLPILLPNLTGLALALALVGLLTGPIDVGTLTLRQRRTPPNQLGRVMAISMSLNMSGQPIGAAIGGSLAGWSPAAALLAAAAAAALSALAARALIPPDQR
jgi:predicted MFS family arabinose efflux permease